MKMNCGSALRSLDMDAGGVGSRAMLELQNREERHKDLGRARCFYIGSLPAIPLLGTQNTLTASIC